MLGHRELGVGLDDAVDQAGRRFQERTILDQVGKLKPARPRLAVSKKVTRTPELEIALRELEPIVGLAQRSEAKLGVFGHRLAMSQQTRTPLPGTPDAAAELMQLSEAETLGLLDDDDVGVWNVDPDLENRSPYEHVSIALSERPHRMAALVGGETAVSLGDAVVPEMRLHLGDDLVHGHELVRGRDRRTHHERSASSPERTLDLSQDE